MSMYVIRGDKIGLSLPSNQWLRDLGDIWEVKPIRRLYSEHVRIINNV